MPSLTAWLKKKPPPDPKAPTWLGIQKLTEPPRSQKANHRAYMLTKQILSPTEWDHLHQAGAILIQGKYGRYYVGWNGMVGLCDPERQTTLCTFCILFESDLYYTTYPALDHFLAKVLVLKNDEDYFWSTAVVQPHSSQFKHPEYQRVRKLGAPSRQRKEDQ